MKTPKNVTGPSLGTVIYTHTHMQACLCCQITPPNPLSSSTTITSGETVKHTPHPARQRLLSSSPPKHLPHISLHPPPSQHALQQHQHLIKQSISHLVCIAVPSQPCIHMPPHQHKPQHVHLNTQTHLCT